MEIKNSYLMWVGKEHYGDIAAYSEEAVTLGISKRVPNVGVAKALTEPGTVVFVAHDEGESHDCPDCQGEIECPECRKRDQEVASLKAAIAKVRDKHEDFDNEASKGDKRFVAVREAKIAKLEAASESCAACDGEGLLTSGTGGMVTLKDGRVMDYRQYNYWLHQPAKFDPDTVSTKKMCGTCGGTGLIPDAKVFGMFLPEGVEYILSGDEDDEKRKVLDGVKAKLIDAATLKAETKRGCGFRKKGGTYVVTSPKAADPAKVREAVAALVEKGTISPDGVEVAGSFIRFTRPIDVEVKRFRGIKSWSLDPKAEREAEMAAEALED